MPAALKHFAFAFLSCLAITTFFFEVPRHVPGNFVPRILLTRAIVERGSAEITKDRDLLGFDQALYRDGVYASHSPGLSWLMVPSYALVGRPVGILLAPRTLSADSSASAATSKAAKRARAKNLSVETWLTATTSILLLFSWGWAHLIYLIQQLAPSLKQPRVAYLTLTLAALPVTYITSLSESALASALVIACVYHLWRYLSSSQSRLQHGLLVGCLAAVIVTLKPSNIFFAAPLVVVGCTRGSLPSRIAIGLPTAVAVFALLAYNKLVFDGYLTWPRTYFQPRGELDPVRLAANAREKFFDAQLLSLEKLRRVVFSFRSGLFTFQPHLAFSLYGTYLLLRKEPRRLWWAVASGAGLFLFFMMGFKGWANGANFGWRNGLPLIGLLTILSIGSFSKTPLSRSVSVAYFICAVAAALYISPALLTYARASEEAQQNPLLREVLPRLTAQGATNLVSDLLGKSIFLGWATSIFFLTLVALWAFFPFRRPKASQENA